MKIMASILVGFTVSFVFFWLFSRIRFRFITVHSLEDEANRAELNKYGLNCKHVVTPVWVARDETE